MRSGKKDPTRAIHPVTVHRGFDRVLTVDAQKQIPEGQTIKSATLDPEPDLDLGTVTVNTAPFTYLNDPEDPESEVTVPVGMGVRFRVKAERSHGTYMLTMNFVFSDDQEDSIDLPLIVRGGRE